MNKAEKMKHRNDMARRLEHTSAMHRNCIRLHKQNSEKHEMKKAEICWRLLRENKEFVTEAKFKKPSIRADIFVLDDEKLIEIETSEYKLEERKSDYPDDLELEVVRI